MLATSIVIIWCVLILLDTASLPVGESGTTTIILPQSSLPGLGAGQQTQHQIIFTNTQGKWV